MRLPVRSAVHPSVKNITAYTTELDAFRERFYRMVPTLKDE